MGKKKESADGISEVVEATPAVPKPAETPPTNLDEPPPPGFSDVMNFDKLAQLEGFQRIRFLAGGMLELAHRFRAEVNATKLTPRQVDEIAPMLTRVVPLVSDAGSRMDDHRSG